MRSSRDSAPRSSRRPKAARPVNRDTAATDHGAWLPVVLRDAALGLAALYLLLYIVLAGLRLGYPFELEWMEGGAVDHVRRIIAGQGLYVPPSLEFVPFIYPPLYFYVSALVARITGVGFLPLRMVSFAASIGCFIMLFLIVRRGTAARTAAAEAVRPADFAAANFAAVLAVGIFAACYRAAGAWFDIARVDSLALFLLLAAVWLLQRNASLAAYLGAAALVALAFLSKQITLLMAAPLMLFAARYRGRRGLLFVGAAIILAGGSVLVLNRLTGGWYNYYIFRLPAEHPLLPDAIRDFWTRDLLWVLPIALPAAIYFLAAKFAAPTRRGFFFWSAAGVGMVGGAWVSRVHVGGYDNVLMPAYAAAAMLSAMGAHTALTWASGRPMPTLWRTEVVVYLLCIAQLGRLYYSPARQLPTARDRQAGEQLVAIMKHIPGEVLMPEHGYLPSLAGKGAHAQGMAVFDVLRGGDEQAYERLAREFANAVKERRFGAIIADQGTWLPPKIDTYYTAYMLPWPDDVLWPVTGMRTRPQYLYLPKRLAPDP